MMQLRTAKPGEEAIAMSIIDMAKAHLKSQNIDQWQRGYPSFPLIVEDVKVQKGYFLVDGDEILGYMLIDFDGEPAYNDLIGSWNTSEPYVVVHRMAFSDACRGRGISNAAFSLVEELARARGVFAFRIDTDEGNKKMQHILAKNGFTRCGTIWFEDSEKIAFDKSL